MKKALLAWGIALAFPAATMAQDKVEASVGADLVSKYVWRGQDLGGVSIQPALTLEYKGFWAEAWGNVGIDSNDTKEIDLTVGYAVGGLSISITDFWMADTEGVSNKYFQYGAHSTAHTFEAQVGYDFGPLALSWNTIFAGCDGVNKDGERAYSTYISATAPFTLGGLEWEAEVGAMPWSTDYYEGCERGFSVCNISLSASKEIKITESFTLPAYAQVVFNPRTEGAHFVFGLSF